MRELQASRGPRSRRLALLPLSLAASFLVLAGCHQEDGGGKKADVAALDSSPSEDGKQIKPAPKVPTAGDDKSKTPSTKDKPEKADGPTEEVGKEDGPRGDVKIIPIAKNVALEVEGAKRRVLIQAHVCLRAGQLEQFLTRKRTKEHESLLAADIDARRVHAALLAAGAEEGSPVKFVPKYQPATGSLIRVTVRYERDGKKLAAPAQKWIRTIKTKKDMEHHWVFAGSRLIPDPFDKTKDPFYAANDGDVICVSNFETAMLDLPIPSTGSNDDLFFEAYTERIPPVDTPVTVVLEVMPGKGKK